MLEVPDVQTEYIRQISTNDNQMISSRLRDG